MTAVDLELVSFRRYRPALVIRTFQPVERRTVPLPYVTLDEIAEHVRGGRLS